MPTSRWSILVVLMVVLSACGSPQPTAHAPEQPSRQPQATAASAAPTSTAAPTAGAPTLVPTAQPTAPAAATEPPVSQPPASATPTPNPVSTPAVVAGKTVLMIPVGTGAGQVGVTASDGPSTFRIAADGSIRVMDTVNKRLLFFNRQAAEASYKLAQTLDLASLKRPTDFVVTGQGDLYVLDAEGWTIAHLTIDGKALDPIPLNPATKGAFTTLSLTADGRLMGLAGQTGYILATASGPLALEDQPNARLDGTVTVRSNALFAIAPDSSSRRRQSLLINYGGIAPTGIDLGVVDGAVTFLDINQGMEPYVLVARDTAAEVRRYNIDGELLGTLVLDLTGCRAVARGVYVDRPGDVFTMCVDEQAVTFKQYSMSDANGQPLPRFDRLVESTPWSPGNLQSAPG